MSGRLWRLACALLGVVVLAVVLTGAQPARALDSLYIMAPAAPGGGWDGTARSKRPASSARSKSRT